MEGKPRECGVLEARHRIVSSVRAGMQAAKYVGLGRTGSA